MTRTSLNTPYLVITLAVLIGVAALFTLIRPQWAELTAARATVAELEATVAEKQAVLAAVDSKRAALNQQQQHEQQLDIVLPGDDATDDAVRLLSRVAAATGITIVTLENQSVNVRTNLRAAVARNEQTHVPAGIEPLAFSVSARGTYQQFRAFFDSLNRLVRLTDVLSIEFKRDEVAADVLNATLQLQLYTYPGGSDE